MGSAERGLVRLGLRYAVWLRFVVIAVASGASLVLENERKPGWAIFIVLALNAWNAWYAARMSRSAARWPVAVDVLVMCAICLTQVWTTPTAPSPEGTSWVRVAAAITVVAYPWQLGAGALGAATAAITAAHLAGTALSLPEHWLTAAPIHLWMFMEAGLSWGLYLLVRRGARTADQIVARGERLRRRSAVAEARRTDEREHLAALHDTASATLLMVGAGVMAERQTWFAEQAKRDLEVIRGRSEVSGGEADLVGMLRETITRTPLRVRLTAPDELVVPAVEAVALCHGTREALTNVVRHAGVDRADVAVAPHGDSVVVEVVDAGHGFDPDRISGHRYGVTGSLVERMRRTGGSAEVISSPGGGTRVRMTCPLGAAEDAGGDAEIIATKFLQGMQWAVVVMNLVILCLLDLPKLLTNLDGYRSTPTQFLAFAGFLAVTLIVLVSLRRQRPIGRWRWPLLALVFALSAAGTASVQPEHLLGFAHWSEGDAGWTVALLLLDCRVPTFALTLIAHYVMTFAQVGFAGNAAISFSDAVNATVLILSYQTAVGLIAAVLRGLAVSSARAAREEEQLRTAEEVARQLHQDRKNRYADLEGTTVPLLDGLGSGALDPGDVSVRRRCSVEAAKMRRLFAEDASTPDPLLHELRACIELAERQGVSVRFAEYGKRPAIPREVRRRLTEPAVTALATATGTVRVTVAGSGDTVTVSLVAAAVEPVLAEPRSDGDVVTSTVVDGGRIWVEAKWSRPT
ncbi:ATP-binding protein [Saccharopolyspora shandongensis]|uniref:sensor histidine kinase n=1 Tax=Saccharopolyspora shandongensis TaxID=418495 RepID=UPI0034157706